VAAPARPAISEHGPVLAGDRPDGRQGRRLCRDRRARSGL